MNGVTEFGTKLKLQTNKNLLNYEYLKILKLEDGIISLINIKYESLDNFEGLYNYNTINNNQIITININKIIEIYRLKKIRNNILSEFLPARV